MLSSQSVPRTLGGEAEARPARSELSISSTLTSSGATTYGDSTFWSFFIFLQANPFLLAPQSLSFLLVSSFPLGKHSGEPSSPPTLKLFGKERLAGGRRPLEVGRAGNAGGKSFGFSSSSLRRSESNISSNELRTINDGDADNIIFFFSKIEFKFRNVSPKNNTTQKPLQIPALTPKTKIRKTLTPKQSIGKGNTGGLISPTLSSGFYKKKIKRKVEKRKLKTIQKREF
ncbi:LOW QUALITY PROTEIN: hypothetical protein TorRG33x02_078050 [Trema orientale]|uniref:Uncharacterized protein n=1 Tax=Trema orientale TaxID=63057 RepID=A0A2P5FFH7_TREOI|nr:LOW QUALITY PROTEIN: hypothetical protein TorRG33x02_078050 [Trema orientale]